MLWYIQVWMKGSTTELKPYWTSDGFIRVNKAREVAREYARTGVFIKKVYGHVDDLQTRYDWLKPEDIGRISIVQESV